MMSAMRLMTLHRVLIKTMLALAVLYAVREFRTGGTSVMFFAACAVAVGTIAYLAYLHRNK